LLNVFNKMAQPAVRPQRPQPNWISMMTQAFPPPVAGREPMTRRALAKQRTRQRLLAAAKRLVTERGYEAATVRDIAGAADLSTGAVFASFSDKADLFNEVILADHAALLAQMDAAAAEENSARATLIKLLALAYAFHFEELPLVQAAIGFSWLREGSVERRNREGVKLILARLSVVLRAGVESGELSPSLDVELIAEMVWDSYVANYRRAIFDGWDMAALRARIADQIEVLLDGYQIAA
jgi:AcrR family transcriptional regulator